MYRSIYWSIDTGKKRQRTKQRRCLKTRPKSNRICFTVSLTYHIAGSVSSYVLTCSQWWGFTSAVQGQDALRSVIQGFLCLLHVTATQSESILSPFSVNISTTYWSRGWSIWMKVFSIQSQWKWKKTWSCYIWITLESTPVSFQT